MANLSSTDAVVPIRECAGALRSPDAATGEIVVEGSCKSPQRAETPHRK